MPDRGVLDPGTVSAVAIAEPAQEWRLTGVRLAQITYEVSQPVAMATMPNDVTRPIPCYARLFVLEAADSPAGPLRLAALMTGARYQLMPRNVVVDGIIEGPATEFAKAFGSPWRDGSVRIERNGHRLVVNVGDATGTLAEFVAPELRAVEPGMLRWDAWLGFAAGADGLELIEYGPQPQPSAAFLSKAATLEVDSRLPRAHRWRTFRNLNTITSCYLEGDVVFSAAVVKQGL